MTYRARRRSMLAALTLLWLWIFAAAPRAAVRAATSDPLSADPPALALALPLGASTSQTVTITNNTASVLAPTVLEANPVFAAAPAAPHAAGATRVALPQQPGRVDPQLARELADPAARADFMIYLRDQADLAAAYQIRDWNARGQYVYATLRDYAERSQRGLRAELAARGLAYRPFWVANAVLVRGGLADAQALAARADVALVRANHIAALPAAATAQIAADARCSPDDPGNPICWNLRKIGVDRVWRDFGVAGRGIVVANIDTGVRFDHPALARQYRGWRGAASYDHNYSWFDPKGLNRAPADPHGHGTHTMGSMVASGAGTTTRPAVGVAPEASWIAAQGCASSNCGEVDLISSAQWLLAPTDLDGRSPRPDLRPMIVNNSWSAGGGDSWYAGYTAAWRAAGIFPLFAAGNSGSACRSINSPGDYPDVLGIGATDQNDLAASFSARGPTADGRRKPDFMAPGGSPGILSTAPGDGESYRVLQGTSMATPQVAGLVALLWSANPNLVGDYDATVDLLRASAHALGDTSCGDQPGAPNNVYGYGRVDAYAAVQRARPDIAWLSVEAAPAAIGPGASAALQIRVDSGRVAGPGVYHARVQLFASPTSTPTAIDITLTVAAIQTQALVTGRVLSAESGAPLAATVGVRAAQPVATGAQGEFALTLAPGVYQLVASAPSFASAERLITVSGDLQLPDIALLPDYPRAVVGSTPISAELAFGESRSFGISIANSGARPLQFHARVLPDAFGAFRSDEPGGPAYSWRQLPNTAATLDFSKARYQKDVPLGFEFPFYNGTFTDTVVAADGFLAFSTPPASYTALASGCFPDIGFSFFEIAPFRADVDLAAGGAVHYATLDQGRTFVLSYEQVRLRGDASGSAYSFQVLLHADGRIVYQYRAVPAAPQVVAVGLQRTFLDYQQIGCGSAAPLHSGLAIELRPQAAPAQWLTLSAAQGAVQPAAEQTLTATLRWGWPQSLPQRARIEISSSDPLRERVIVPVQAVPHPPPWVFWLPVISRQQW